MREGVEVCEGRVEGINGEIAETRGCKRIEPAKDTKRKGPALAAQRLSVTHQRKRFERVHVQSHRGGENGT